MSNRKSFTKLMVCVLSALTVPNVLNLPQVKAQEGDCRKFVRGTYIVTVTGDTTYRETITFTSDGNFIASDSNQQGIPGTQGLSQPFSIVQGRWRCIGAREIVATGINYNFPTTTAVGTIVRDEYRLRFSSGTPAIQGKVTFANYNINADPLNRNTRPVAGPFRYTLSGQRVDANSTFFSP